MSGTSQKKLIKSSNSCRRLNAIFDKNHKSFVWNNNASKAFEQVITNRGVCHR